MILKSGYFFGAAMAQVVTRFTGRSHAKGTYASGADVFDLMTAKPLLPAPSEQNEMLARNDLIVLYQAIEAALPGQDCRIVQFASPCRGEGATTISAGLANLACGLLAQRTLFVDLEADGHSTLRRKPSASLVDVVSGRAQITSAVVSATNSASFDYAYLSSDNAEGDMLVHHEKIKQLLTSLRDHYGLIVMHASNMLANPAGGSLSRLADGVILVVEAERTRAPAAKQVLSQMGEKGVRVLGLAFNKRRFYIPDWLYRRL